MILTIYLFLTFKAIKAIATATIILILTINLLFLSYLFVVIILKEDFNRNEFQPPISCLCRRRNK